jgi:hypothetical protein
MFQCIIQQRNGWIRNSPELKDVFPGKSTMYSSFLLCFLTGNVLTSIQSADENMSISKTPRWME